MYNNGRGIEFGFDSANTSYIDFHSYDSLNVDYDARIICGSSYGNSNNGGGSINITALNLLWNSNAGIPLNTKYAGCRICLCYGASPNNWYGFGINAGILI